MILVSFLLFEIIFTAAPMLSCTVQPNLFKVDKDYAALQCALQNYV